MPPITFSTCRCKISTIMGSKYKKYFNIKILPCLIIIFLFGGLYYPVFKSLIVSWYRDWFAQYGCIIPFISGYLVWLKRSELKSIKIYSDKFGLIFLIFGAFLFILGERSGERFASHLSIVFVLFGLIYYLLGKEIIKSLLFPIIFLFFMIPIPFQIITFLSFKLKFFASNASAFIASVLRIPIYKEHNVINLPNCSFVIVEGCSGIKSILAFMPFSALYSYFFSRKLFKQILIFLLGIPFALLGNVIRLVLLFVSAFYISENIALKVFHGYPTILVFLITLTMYHYSISLFLRGNIKKHD